MKVLKRLKRYFVQKRLLKMDVLMFVLLFFGVCGYQAGSTWYELLPRQDAVLINPYLVQADRSGNTFVIDNERSRVVKINENMQIEYMLKSNLKEADSFWYAEDIAFDSDGTTYLLDSSWDDTGAAVGRECILAYDVNGKYVDTLLDITYEDEFVDKHKLFALTFWENALYYVESEQEGFALFCLFLQTGEVEEISFYEYDNAFNLIQDYAIDKEGTAVYALDKRGRILKGSEGDLELLYDTGRDTDYVGQTALYRIAVDGERTIYVTDIKQNKIYSYTEGSDSFNVYMDEGIVMSISAAWQEDGSSVLGILLDNEIRMRHVPAGEQTDNGIFAAWNPTAWAEVKGDIFAKTTGYLLRETGFQLSALAIILGVLWLLARIVVFLAGIKLSAVQKSGMLAAGPAAIVAIIIVFQLLNQFAIIYQEELMNKLHIMAHTISGMVDGDSLGRIRTSEDYMSEDYQELMRVLDQGLNRQDPFVQGIYCNVLRYEDGQGFAIAYQDNSIGTYFPRGEDESLALASAFETGEEYSNEVKDATGSYIYVWSPVLDKDGEVVGVVEIGTTTYIIISSVAEMRQSIIITLVLIMLIVLFLFGEVLSFFDQRAKYRMEQKQSKENAQRRIPLHLLRLGIFITYTAFNIASSFLPVYAASFVTDDLGLPRELAASLPITLNLIFVGVTSLFCAPLLKHFSFRSVAAVSAGISMLGDLTLFLGHSYLFIVFGLVLNGIGMGLIINSINMFIASISEDEVKQEGFSLFNAGSLSGINCGMMLGASLAGVLGQRTVFTCSAAAWGLAAVLFLIMGIHMGALSKEDTTKKRGVGPVLTSRGVIPYMLLIQLPYVVINSFVFYYVPIYGDAQGFSETTVCLFLMLNSLCSVYLSVPVTNFMKKRLGMGSIYLSSAISLAALLMFGFNSTVPMLIVVLLLLGFAGSFAIAVRQFYFTNLRGVQEYGEESAMGVYNLMDNVGESAGPILFSSIMGAASPLTGLTAFVVCSGVMNAIYGGLFGFRKAKNSKIT